MQMGTVFLACEESGAHPLHREAILSGKAGRTALTQGFTGRLARGIDNELLQMLNKPGAEILPYLERLTREWPTPLLYVSHAMVEVERLAQQIVNIRDGHVTSVVAVPSFTKPPEF